MELHVEPPVELDDQPEQAVTQVIARLRRVGSESRRTGLLFRDRADDELLDQFWRRRSRGGDG